MMQRYMMNFSTKEMPARQCECLVIGSGVAGLMAAWKAAESGLRVLLVVRDTLWDSNTNKAQGGIAASFGPDDEPELHVQDTLIAGAGLSDEHITRIVTTEGPQDILDLIAHGAIFDRQGDGQLALGREGCHCRSRIVHAKGDATGAEVARTLNSIVAEEPSVDILEHCYVVDLLTDNGCCYGATALLDGEKICLRAGAVILASGGCGRLYDKTTNPEGAVGAGVAMAYRAGADVMDMEFVQFHPTALSIKGCPNFLISEAVRGAGAVLRNLTGKRFMPEYHALAELAPRDVVARCIFKEMQAAATDHIYLDARAIGQAAMKFPMIARTCRDYGIDIEHEMIPVAPAAHYMMGGIRTDEWGRTNILGLYACGEAACTGLQGANRLASNSLLEGLVFGRRAARHAAGYLDRAETKESFDWCCQALIPVSGTDTIDQTSRLQQLMGKFLGIRRDATGMRLARKEIARLEQQYDGQQAEQTALLDLRARITLAGLVTGAALRRQESRGAHFRTDYPEKREEWCKHFTDCQAIGIDRTGAMTDDVRIGQAAASMA